MLRLSMGGAFIYAGWVKAQDPVGFADSVASFAILPRMLVAPFALALPIFEIGAGVLVLTGSPASIGPWARIGPLALLSLTGVFCIALMLAIARGLDVNCGCFGPSASTTNPWFDLGRDLLIIAGCAWLYRREWLNRRDWPSRRLPMTAAASPD